MRSTQNSLSVCLTLGAALLGASFGPPAALAMRAITVKDCVETRRIVSGELQISKDGSLAAFVVKAPDVRTNRNDYQLRIVNLHVAAGSNNGRLLLQADGISGIRWVTSRKIIARVEERVEPTERTDAKVVIIDTSSGRKEVLKFAKRIEEYSASADGRTIALSTVASATEPSNGEPKDRIPRDWTGYPILFGQGDDGAAEQLPRYEIFLAHRVKNGTFRLQQLSFPGAPGQPRNSSLRSVLRLNLSPDGKYLLVNYSADSLPSGWRDQPFVRFATGLGTFVETYVLGLYDISTGRMRLGYNFPAGLIHTSWAEDGQSYAVVGPSPFGTDESRSEAISAGENGDVLMSMNRFQHVFTVDARSGAVSRVLDREGGEPGNIKFWRDLPLFWRSSDGPMLVRDGDNTVVWLSKEHGKWKQAGQLDVVPNQKSVSALASDGDLLVGVSQTRMIPPDLFVFDLKKRDTRTLTDLNPEYREISLGRIEEIGWSNHYGSDCKGIIVLPVGYKPGQLYPMIFMGTGTSGEFFSDVPYASTAFAPQSLAAAGFVVVIAQYPLNDKTPKGLFPGEMSEAFNWMAMVEGAIDHLVERRIADKNNVGVIGFSRTSWLTDFVLAHSSYHFAAASSADGGIYTYGAYFRYNSQAQIRSAETQVGGAPYEEGFKNWQDSAPPFNAQHVNVPILMEYTHTAEHGFEFFVALNRLCKAVELFRYPKGDHPLDTPLERLASLQRNVDWFRFWMQDYEREPPKYDRSQYLRWRNLRARTKTTDSGRVDDNARRPEQPVSDVYRAPSSP